MRGKLSPRYIGQYEIIKKLYPKAYRLDLPVDLKHIHNMLHILQLEKYVLDPDHVIVIKPIEVMEDLVYEECPV